ncbi:DUF927 domain-containing protein [Xanthobacter versatilis]|uniref:DUF927 domain-containing protein n=1 Tax=Xanthobacter autotrophicus (strain ATCC BAA-1158 / Py2) TaxID=78245 RepID=UPI00372BC1BC
MPRARKTPWVQPLEIQHRVDSDEFFVEVDFETVTGHRERAVIPRSQMDDPRGAKRMLAARGAAIPEDWLKDLQTALQASGCDVVCSTAILGWHDTSAYLFPDGAIGRRRSLRPMNPTPADRCVRGETKNWRLGLKTACEASSFLTFAVATGFAGCMLRRMGQDEGAVFHLIGESSTGKSLASTAAQSVIEQAGREYMRTHDLTDRALEEDAAACNDSLLVLDEAGRIEGTPAKRLQHMQVLAYKLCGGQGRKRSARAVADHALRNVQFLLYGLSSGEEALDGTGIRRRNEGEQVRLIGIPIPPREDGGVFDREPSGERRAELAREVERTICDHYGRPIRHFVRNFLADEEAVAKAKNYAGEFIEKVVTAPSPFAERFARKFAVVYAAAMLAAEYGVAPWTRKGARASIRKVHQLAWEIVRPAASAADDLLSWLRHHANDEALFPEVMKGEAVEAKAAEKLFGIRRQQSRVSILALLRDRLPELVPASQADSVLASLKARGYLLKGKEPGRYVRQLRVQGLLPPRRDYLFFDLARLCGAQRPKEDEADAA